MPTSAVPRRAPYKDFLQPALQRRFASTATVLLCIAYVESLSLSRWNSFIWPWFPLGPAGLRTLGIFGAALPILILRIACCHIGNRTTGSAFQTLTRDFISPQTAEVIATHILSAWTFSQLYLLSIPDDSTMRWIHYSGSRQSLNERALFYTVNLIFMGLDRALMHLVWDLDRLNLGSVLRKIRGQEAPPPRKDPWARFFDELPRLVLKAGVASLVTASLSYLVLYTLVRPWAYGWALWFFRFFYNLPKSNLPPGSAPWSFWMLGRSAWAGFLLCLLWDLSDVFFALQLAKEPLKNNQPLTSESKDPNGSLLNGLKNPKSRVSAFALWELALISKDFEARRQAIYQDIDRKDGPMWSQIYSVCLNLLKTVESRIDNYGKPPPPPAAAQPAIADVTQNLQRIAQAPKSEDVYQTATGRRGTADRISEFAKSRGSSPGRGPSDTLVPLAKQKALEYLPESQKQNLTPEGRNKLFQTLSMYVLRMPVVGDIFQQTFSRRLTGAVFGTPYGELSLYVNASYILSQLAVCSLSEDNYGNVQRDVPTVIRTFTLVIKKLEKFRDEFPVHWTDISQDRECLEVEQLLDSLKGGLQELIEGFAPYSTDLRLSRADMRLAREAASEPVGAQEQSAPKTTGFVPEMRQVIRN